MSRAYIRLAPDFFERKFIDQGYTPSEALALIGCLCLADAQPERGRFRNDRYLRALLDKLGKHVQTLIDRGDLVRLADGRLMVDGWDEWQEGDVTVKERMARLRQRRDRNTDRNADRNTQRHRPSGTANTLSEVVEPDGAVSRTGLIPPPPAQRGRRKDETNPRATGTSLRQLDTNPRAVGTSERQVRQAYKTTPMNVGAIMAGLGMAASGEEAAS